jgi:hypothetical protein
MSPLPVLVFDPILHLPETLIPTDYFTRGDSITADEYAARRNMTIDTPPTIANASFLDTSSQLQQHFIQLLSTWNVTGSATNDSDPPSETQPPPSQAEARTTRASTSDPGPTATGADDPDPT